jgi:hypothetical protein
VPEECLLQVIAVIRAGLKALPDTDADIEHNLLKWCAEEEEYMKAGQEDE